MSNPTTTTRWWRAGLVILAGLMLAACGQVTMHSNLDENQANEVLAVLLANGINADKRASVSSENGYQIRVSRGEFAQAMEALRARGLPRPPLQSLCDVFQRQGFVSSATEERARQQCGWEQDLTRTLSSYAGVASARVHIALPERDPIGGTMGDASASVVIFEQAGANLRNEEHNFKVLVKDAVPGLSNINQVSVKFNTLPPPATPGERGNAPPVMSAMSPVTLAVAAGAIALLALLVTLGNRLRVRLQGKPAADDRIWKG